MGPQSSGGVHFLAPAVSAPITPSGHVPQGDGGCGRPLPPPPVSLCLCAYEDEGIAPSPYSLGLKHFTLKRVLKPGGFVSVWFCFAFCLLSPGPGLHQCHPRFCPALPQALTQKGSGTGWHVPPPCPHTLAGWLRGHSRLLCQQQLSHCPETHSSTWGFNTETR